MIHELILNLFGLLHIQRLLLLYQWPMDLIGNKINCVEFIDIECGDLSATDAEIVEVDNTTCIEAEITVKEPKICVGRNNSRLVAYFESNGAIDC